MCLYFIVNTTETESSDGSSCTHTHKWGKWTIKVSVAQQLSKLHDTIVNPFFFSNQRCSHREEQIVNSKYKVHK